MVDFIKKINWSGIDASTVSRLLITALAVVNIILRMCGAEQFLIPDDQVYNLVSAVFLIVTTGYAIYKNTNLTDAAQTSQQILDMLKAGEIAAEQLEDFIGTIKEEQE